MKQLDDPPAVSRELRIAALVYVVGLIIGILIGAGVMLAYGVVDALSALLGGGR